MRTIKEIRKLTGLPQRIFAEKYEIPFNTLRSWEAAPESSKHRKCPEYVVKLLEFKVLYDLNQNVSGSRDTDEEIKNRSDVKCTIRNLQGMQKT